jgi:hypothetical protein
MSEFVDLMEPCIDITFKGWKEKHKELVDFILQISNLNLSQLAEVIEANLETLHGVTRGEEYLTKQAAINLNQLIYMFSCSREFEA